MKKDKSPLKKPATPPLEEGLDYYLENGNLVFTARFLLNRGYCCESGCRHCPYGFRKKGDRDQRPPETTGISA